jgi:hypothetical protein
MVVFLPFEAGSNHIKDFQSMFFLFCHGKRLEILSFRGKKPVLGGS